MDGSRQEEGEQGEQEEMETKRRNKIIECAMKAEHMAGIGPIYMTDVITRMDGVTNFEKAKALELKAFLARYLGYEEEELRELTLEETKFATSGDDLLYVAMVDKEQIKELHIRRAESQNENITVRNYIPPNFHERFVYINKMCTEQRRLDKALKTQLRFGHGDIEVFMKYKGEDAGYRLVKLSEFTDITAVPEFNHKIRWKRYVDRPPRRKIRYSLENPIKGKEGEKRPATGRKDQETTQRKLTRQHSKDEGMDSKKARLSAKSSYSDSSSSPDEDINEMDTEIEDGGENSD